MSKHMNPSLFLAALALAVSIGFSSLPSAVAGGATDAASSLGLTDPSAKPAVNLTVARARLADTALKLGRYRAIARAPSGSAPGAPPSACSC